MSEPEVRAEVSIKCGSCERITDGVVLEGLGDRHGAGVTCEGCGTRHWVDVEVEAYE